MSKRYFLEPSNLDEFLDRDSPFEVYVTDAKILNPDEESRRVYLKPGGEIPETEGVDVQAITGILGRPISSLDKLRLVRRTIRGKGEGTGPRVRPD